MESLSETEWDVVINGTGLQQSLLALALSRSGKNILHVDRDECYGGSEAALSLQDADEWVTKHKGPGTNSVFAAAEVKKSDDGLSSSRAYSLALAPQLIHTRSDLLAKLVSSKAFRQLEFLAVGSFYVYQQAADAESKPTLNRIPSTREDVFVNKVISMKSKRGLMKFLKFVLDYKAEEQLNVWTPHKDAPLSEFLASEFKLDEMLQSYIVTLTMSLDGKVSVEDGLNAISRHLTSMGVFGPGFAAVYPKWGGLSEVAQVGCRGGAVGGAIYILGTGVDKVENTEDDQPLSVTLTNDLTVKTKSFIQESAEVDGDATTLSRLTAIVDSTLSNLFEVLVEGAPTPSASVVAFPAGSLCSADGNPSSAPIYAMLHSGDTGECPSSQCAVYLSTIRTSSSKELLEKALDELLRAAGDETPAGKPLYRLSYEHSGVKQPSFATQGKTGIFSPLPLDLAFNDSTLAPVEQAWKFIVGETDEEYMVFEDREGVNDEDDRFD